ncbi:hypothetical protein [Elizabethkingia anophelis]|uniref:hypothetical protein n=1 Tax=Elizabethkingia anophelis TaxID=1117645 RepID=UPI000442B62A|nr:hypothetical protein [Elizabethkingia anophelis]CDN73621.1 exported hypothetical protein [Elizabethkingia anophelis]CDN79885.1 exported hypothetical protein [Elizabethkingia anophelis]
MKKNLFKPFLWGILTLSTLSSCRTEDNLNQQQQEKDMRFAVFTPQPGKTVNYADGFAHLMKRYDSIHKTNLSGMNNAPVISHLNASTDKNNLSSQNGETFVAFNIRSQTVTEENGNKWVVFPEVTNGKIANLVIGFLSEKETKVHYYLASKESELYKNNISLFQSSLERYMKRINKLNLNASLNPVSYVKEAQIEEVVITVPKKNLDPRESFGGINPAYNTGRGSCSDYGGCINDYYAPGGGGGGGSSTPTSDMVMPPPPKKPILDIKKFLSCFDQSKSANLTVYAQNMLASPPGHAFITIQQGNNIMTFGFYPRDPYLNSLSGRGIMGEDDLHPYNQALNVGTISPAQLQQIISRAIDYASTRYDLAVRNCADFAREALNIANVPGANWDSNWLRPTDIANIINAQKSGVMGSGTSPVTQRTCNN